jgi:hypothetical protein
MAEEEELEKGGPEAKEDSEVGNPGINSSLLIWIDDA